MTQDWRQIFFNKHACQGVVLNEGTGDVVVKGTVNSNSPNPVVIYWAANPPTYSTSFSGSGLPYPNPEVAYNRTSNAGAVRANNREFSFKLKHPNAYYVGLGTLYIPPHVHIKVCESDVEDIHHTIQLGEGIPFRTLTYPAPPSEAPRISPLFYQSVNNVVRTQEQIIRDGGYPLENKMPTNFWGLRPPR